MNNTKALVLSKLGLPSTVQYSESTNAFLTSGYTSMAGNTYYNAIRIAEGILIKEDVGQGYIHTFLNAIRIYSLKDKTLLADRAFHNRIYSKCAVKREAVDMLMDVLREAAINEGLSFDELQARNTIENIIEKALNTNQLEMFQNQTRKYLGS